MARAVEDRNRPLALTVYGPLGCIDLLVPSRAVTGDVAREYAVQTGLALIPLIHTRRGEPLALDIPLVDVGVDTGDVLVASTALLHPPRDSSADHPWRSSAGSLANRGALLCVAAGIAVVAGWLSAVTVTSRWHLPAVAALLCGALLALLPVGGHRHDRGLAAAPFVGAAVFAMIAETDQAEVPLVLGMAGLGAAVAAAVARALDHGTGAPARVCILTGAGLFAVTGLAAALDVHPRVTWSVLLVLALVTARVVPTLAVDVPDALLLDRDGLAATAWSARERPTSPPGQVVCETLVADVAARGLATVTAVAAVVLMLAATCSPLLLHAAELPLDRVGARALVFLCGGGLLLGARSYRQAPARLLLVAAGLACWIALVWALLPVLSAGQWLAVAGCAGAFAAWLVPAAVATGRGWRSAWWARRAEVAEGVCTAAAMAAAVVSAGVFRLVWESVS